MENLVRLSSRLSIVALTVLLLGAYAPAAAYAHESVNDALVVNESSDGETTFVPEEQLAYVDDESVGSITVTLTKGGEGTSVEGVEVTCLKVGDIEGGEYQLENTYEGLGLDINNLKSADDLEKAAKKIADAAGSKGGTAKTDSNGKVVFSDLGIGVYLIDAVENDKYDVVTPSLVSIPTWSEENGEMVYDLSVMPKHEARKKKEPDEPSGKGSPQTNVETRLPYYGAGCVAILVALVGFNVYWSFRSKRKK